MKGIIKRILALFSSDAGLSLEEIHAKDQGYRAYSDGWDSNPYPENSDLGRAWRAGHEAAFEFEGRIL